MFFESSFRSKVITEFSVYLNSLQSKEAKKCYRLFLCELDNYALMVIYDIPRSILNDIRTNLEADLECSFEISTIDRVLAIELRLKTESYVGRPCLKLKMDNNDIVKMLSQLTVLNKEEPTLEEPKRGWNLSWQCTLI